MISEHYKCLFQQALDKWGHQSQIRMGYEECGELISALAQWERGRESDVVEEIADVYLVIQQLRLMFGPDLVDEVIRFKMERLEGKLNV